MAGPRAKDGPAPEMPEIGLAGDDAEAPPAELPDDAFAPRDAAAEAPISLAPRPAPAPPRVAARPPPPERPLPPTPHVAVQASFGVLGILLAVPASLLPERWRRAVGLGELASSTASVVGAVAEAALAGWCFAQAVAAHERRWIQTAGRAVNDYVVNVMGTNDKQYIQGVGMMAYLDFLLSPLGALLLFFFVEGMFRAVAAAAAGELAGMLPLWLVDQGILAGARRRDELRLGRRVADVVTRSAGGRGLTIESCRPRSWSDQHVLVVDDEHWRIAGRAELASGARRWVYRLERVPDNEVMRVVVRYDPADVIAGPPSGWRQLAAEVRALFRRRQD